MADYRQIESDDRLDQAPQGLQFKSFLGNEGSGGGARSPGPRASQGYLREQGQPASFWSIEYYQPYFDIDTKDVLTRCYTTMLPTSANFLTAHLNPAPDLYGPFWTLTTLIFSLFVFSSLASSVSSYLSGTPIDYDFRLLSIATPLVYSYGLGLPVLVWLVLRYLGVSEWGLVEAVSTWGYAQFVWIPVAILCVIPEPIVRWVLVGVAFALSGYFISANVYPVLASAEAKAARLLIIVLFVLHAALAITFKVLFFSYYVIDPAGPKDPLGAPGQVTSALGTMSASATATGDLPPGASETASLIMG